jgi:uracil-DNA glycosylase
LTGTLTHSAEAAIRELIFNIPSTDVLFNQYRDTWQDVDSQKAPIIRQNNLISYVLSVIKSAEVLVVGEAAGPWGCRFSGIAFVGERQLVQASLPFTGQRSSCAAPKLNKIRKAPFVSASSTMFWKVMRQYHPRFLVWDAVPLHPHLTNDRLSVRTPTDLELHQFFPALDAIISIVKPKNILAVGNSAHNSLRKLDHKPVRVRHPANGGFPEFAASMDLAFSVGNRS